jgi:glycosyltransferase involved in cell wall biosynthesis
MQKPLISIGIPTYNRPESLRRTLECITGQTYGNLEIIISDNGSPGDDTEKVVREFMQTDPRIQYYRQTENRGATFNFQFVLEKATGEYFMWAADDDWRHREFVNSLLNAMMQYPDAAIAFCDFNELDVAGNRHPAYPDHLPRLETFTTPVKWLRLLRYFIQDEYLGKANIIFGLMHRRHLYGFNWFEFIEKNKKTTCALDMLFVFKMLCIGRLALSENLLYGCTVGNVKEYAIKEYAITDNEYFSNIMNWIKYATRYIGLSDGISKLLIIIVWPFKIVKLLIMRRNDVRMLFIGGVKSIIPANCYNYLRRLMKRR